MYPAIFLPQLAATYTTHIYETMKFSHGASRFQYPGKLIPKLTAMYTDVSTPEWTGVDRNQWGYHRLLSLVKHSRGPRKSFPTSGSIHRFEDIVYISVLPTYQLIISPSFSHLFSVRLHPLAGEYEEYGDDSSESVKAAGFRGARFKFK